MRIDEPVLLGCTELPVLYELYKSEIENKNVLDPLYMSLVKIKEDGTMFPKVFPKYRRGAKLLSL